MLLHILVNEPRMLVAIVQKTPLWVWMVLIALVALGASQCFARSASVRRTLLMPIALAVFSAWGIGSAFSAAPHGVGVLAAWLVVAGAVAALSLWLRQTPPQRVHYDAAQQRFQLPGTTGPLLLILGIFLMKWAVGVELALQPFLAYDSQFALQITAAYGAINGVLFARAVRLLRPTRTAAHTHPVTTA